MAKMAEPTQYMKNWYVLHTLPTKESLVANYLQSKRLEVLFPEVRERKPNGHGHWKNVFKPLFPRYIFASFDPMEDFAAVRYGRGVSSIVSFGGELSVVSECLIDEIRYRIKDGFVEQDDSPFEADELVTITMGAMLGATGVFKKWKPAKERVEVLLNFLGREQVLDFHISQVCPAAVFA